MNRKRKLRRARLRLCSTNSRPTRCQGSAPAYFPFASLSPLSALPFTSCQNSRAITRLHPQCLAINATKRQVANENGSLFFVDLVVDRSRISPGRRKSYTASASTRERQRHPFV